MTTLLFGNHILVMQLEIQWQEEQRGKSYLMSDFGLLPWSTLALIPV